MNVLRVLSYALVLTSSVCLIVRPATGASQGTDRPVLTQGQAVFRAMMYAKLIRSDRSAPAQTMSWRIGQGGLRQPETGEGVVNGVYVIGEQRDRDGDGAEWFVATAVFPTEAAAKDEMRARRSWPKDAAREPIESDYDEGFVAVVSTQGATRADTGKEAVLPVWPNAEAFLRCGRLFVRIRWNRSVPKAQQPAGLDEDGRVRWARQAFPDMFRAGRAEVISAAKALHEALKRERACGCTAAAPFSRSEPTVGLTLTGIAPKVTIGAPVNGVASVALGGLSAPVDVEVVATVGAAGQASRTYAVTLQNRSNGTHKVALARDLNLTADVASPGPATVRVQVTVEPGARPIRVVRNVPITVLARTRKVVASVVLDGTRITVGAKARLELVCSLKNTTGAPLRVQAADSLSISGPEEHTFAPEPRMLVLEPGGARTYRQGHLVTFKKAGRYTAECRLVCSFADTASARADLIVHPASSATSDDGTGQGKRTDPGDADLAAARKKVSDGRMLMMSGKAPEAEVLLREAVRLNPNNDDYWGLLNSICVLQKKWPDAEAALRKAIALKPDKWEHHNNLAIALHEQGRTADAVAAAREALRLGMPKEAYILGVLGITP